MRHTSIELHCEFCHSDVAFVDERPAWRVDEDRATKMADAGKYAAEHSAADALVDESAGTLPQYVGFELFAAKVWVYDLDSRYVECPNCDKKVYINDNPHTCWMQERACAHLEAE